MELTIFAKKIYDYFAHTIYGKKADWRLINGKKSKDAIDNFISHIQVKHGDSAGPAYVWLYVVFQFGRFRLSNFAPSAHIAIVLPSMIFGNGAIKKYEERKTIDTLTLYKSDWLIEHKLSQGEFVRKYGLTFTSTMQKIDRKKVETKLQSYKDPIKLVVSRSNAGMDLCEDLTDLYNDKDESCTLCSHAIECKTLLKETNLQTYKLRGYE